MDGHMATAMARTAPGPLREGAGAAFDELFDGVDDLIKRVADTENPEIRRMRAKVRASLADAKNAWDETARRPAANLAAPYQGEEDLEGQDQAFGLALLLGIGMIMSIQP